ncbi:MAG: hypothetical protein ACJ70U_01795 [Nitrososphaera sp.]
MSNSSNHVTIFAGALAGAADVVSKIRAPGTAAQTNMVRIISQTAVIFSTMIHFNFIWLYKFSKFGFPSTNKHPLFIRTLS